MQFLGLVNANYATDKDERKSVSGGIFTLGGSIIGWSSKSQGRTALSSTEAEYYSVTLGSQELLFIQNILMEIGELIKPGYILSNNTGAIQLVWN